MMYLRRLIVVCSAVLMLAFAGWSQTAPTPETKTGTLQTGQMACTRVFFTQGPSVELKGDIISKPKVPVDWKLEFSKTGDAGSFTTPVNALARTVDTEILQSSQPNKFPGYFKACVEDTTSFPVTYTLSVGPDTD